MHFKYVCLDEYLDENHFFEAKVNCLKTLSQSLPESETIRCLEIVFFYV